MKKGLIIFVAAFSAALLQSGCSDLRFGDDFLEKAPGIDVTIDTIFSSKMYADRALVSVYATTRCGFPIHNNAWPLQSAGQFQYDFPCSQIDNDVLDALTDIIDSQCTWAGAYNMYYNGAYSAQSENGSHGVKYGFMPRMTDGSGSALELGWIGIRKAFLYINNVDRVPDMSDEEKAVGKAECKVMIAMHYADLLRNFGGVPILRDAVESGKEAEVDYTRKSVQEVADYILQLCDEAAAVLPLTVPDSEDGRMTKASALGLKCRVLGFIASPLFNSNSPYSSARPVLRGGNVDKISEDQVESMYWLGGYEQSRWEDVVKVCEEFFQAIGSSYALVQSEGTDVEDYRSAWNTSYADRGNGEILIQTGRYMPTFADTYLRCFYGVSNDHGNNGRGYGGGCITLNYVDMFPYADGHRADYRKWIADHGRVCGLSLTPFTGRDPRLYESVMIVGDHFQGRPAEMWDDGKEHNARDEFRAFTGFSSRKMIWDYNDETFMNRPTNYSYLRLPEIYLTYAEALNECGRKAEAIEQLNVIRRRVGLPNLSQALLEEMQAGKTLPSYGDPLKGDALLREEILDERARELFFEEVRFYDIVRWKRDDVFKKPLYGIHMTVKNGVKSGDDWVIDENFKLKFEDPFELTARYWRKNWDVKWYLSALPPDEINKGYGLVQNPGW
ncbi:MAG: RagB/SusD family nutrient uptake outer membrane protein [Bacteroidales bacterium]|nr:RagB/SusD family nutrient uptake outer membrane protein [Bacteroidales bacterium]